MYLNNEILGLLLLSDEINKDTISPTGIINVLSDSD